MFTQCTACLVWFRVTREQLHAAHGLVRCSACNTVFNALASLRHDMPEGGVSASSAAATRKQSGNDSGTLGSTELEAPPSGESASASAEAYVGMPGSELEPEPEFGHVLASEPDSSEESVGPGLGQRDFSELEIYLAAALDDEYIGPLPDYTRVEVRNVESRAGAPRSEEEPDSQSEEIGPEPEFEPHATQEVAEQRLEGETPESDITPAFPIEGGTRWPRRAWGLVLVVAALALTAQIVYAQRDALDRIFGLPGPEPVLRQYAISGATLDAAQQPGALVLKGTLVNQGQRVQRLPLIRVTLTDRYGDTVGARILSPRQYGAGQKTLLHAHQHFMFHVKLADPGSSAVGFSLVLCKHHAHSIMCEHS